MTSLRLIRVVMRSDFKESYASEVPAVLRARRRNTISATWITMRLGMDSSATATRSSSCTISPTRSCDRKSRTEDLITTSITRKKQKCKGAEFLTGCVGRYVSSSNDGHNLAVSTPIVTEIPHIQHFGGAISSIFQIYTLDNFAPLRILHFAKLS